MEDAQECVWTGDCEYHRFDGTFLLPVRIKRIKYVPCKIYFLDSFRQYQLFTNSRDNDLKQRIWVIQGLSPYWHLPWLKTLFCLKRSVYLHEQTDNCSKSCSSDIQLVQTQFMHVFIFSPLI